MKRARTSSIEDWTKSSSAFALGGIRFVTEEEMKDFAKEHAMSTDQLLSDRQLTHGDFSDNARIAQELKGILRAYGKGLDRYAHQEALDMICLKMSRIASGQADFEDHWADIAGYAELGRKACASAGTKFEGNTFTPPGADDEIPF